MNLGIVGLIIGVGSIIVSIGIALWQRRPKRVIYDVSANRRLITPTSYETSGALHVKFADRTLKDPHLIVVRVANDGKAEIRPEDWETPFTLKMRSEIIDSAVVGTSSDGLNAFIGVREPHEVRCSKMLLNTGEWFDIQMLVDGQEDVPDVSARIAGAKLTPGRFSTASAEKRPESYRWIPWLLGLVLVIGVVAGVAYYLLSGPPTTSTPLLIGKSLSQVVPALQRANLHLGSQQFIPSSTPAGIVVDQYPSPGTRLDVGSQVSIVISERGKLCNLTHCSLAREGAGEWRHSSIKARLPAFRSASKWSPASRHVVATEQSLLRPRGSRMGSMSTHLAFGDQRPLMPRTGSSSGSQGKR
jgi:hypothetical protein